MANTRVRGQAFSADSPLIRVAVECRLSGNRHVGLGSAAAVPRAEKPTFCIRFNAPLGPANHWCTRREPKRNLAVRAASKRTYIRTKSVSMGTPFASV